MARGSHETATATTSAGDANGAVVEQQAVGVGFGSGRQRALGGDLPRCLEACQSESREPQASAILFFIVFAMAGEPNEGLSEKTVLVEECRGREGSGYKAETVRSMQGVAGISTADQPP